MSPTKEPQGTMTPQQSIQLALVSILEFAQAFGMSRQEAERTYNLVTQALMAAPPEAAQDLLEDLLTKWAPAAQRARRS